MSVNAMLSIVMGIFWFLAILNFAYGNMSLALLFFFIGLVFLT